MKMKISIVDGERPDIKYITAGSEQVIVVENFSSNNQKNEDEISERSYHSIEWKTNARLENIFILMKKLDSEARYDYDAEERKISEKSEPRGMAVGRRSRDEYRLHPRTDFWQQANSFSQLQKEDLTLSLLTPHYRMHCHNLSYKDVNQELPLYVDPITLENVNRRPIREGVNRIGVIAYFNVSNTLAELVTTTSPVFTQDKTTKAILIYLFDQLLSQYQKPTKLH